MLKWMRKSLSITLVLALLWSGVPVGVLEESTEEPMTILPSAAPDVQIDNNTPPSPVLPDETMDPMLEEPNTMVEADENNVQSTEDSDWEAPSVEPSVEASIQPEATATEVPEIGEVPLCIHS